MSSRRLAAIFGSSCRSEPAAALRGLAKRGFPACSCCAFSASNDARGMNTSPRTISRDGAPSSRIGMEWMVLRFSVTSSPMSPSPRVAPRAKTPSRYSSATESPSTFGSTEYSASGSSARTRASNSRSSSSENTSCKLSSGTACCTFWNALIASPPTRRVGLVGEAYCGYSFSRSSKRRSMWS